MSKKQIAANRKNSKKSTGPRDTTKTRLNATKHGLTGTRVTPLDVEAGFEELFQQLLIELKPSGILERLAIERLALWALRMGRAAGLTAKSSYRTPAKQRPKPWTPLDVLQFFDADMGSSKQKEEVEKARETMRAVFDIAKENAPVDEQDPDRERVIAAQERFSKAVGAFFGDVTPEEQPREVVPDEKAQRYETLAENRFFRALHELERIRRMTRGDYIPAPVVVDVSLHDDDLGGESAA